MYKKSVAALLALTIAGVAMLAPTEASARWRRGWGWGGIGAGIAAGAIIGGALASPYYYGGGPYGYYGPGPYYAPGPYAYPPAVAVEGDAVGYCMQRFKSYDPGSGTYLGYDGMRHPCP